jgi:hypothetical protein
MYTFGLSELEQYLRQAGFEGFQPKLDGTFLMFCTRKALPSMGTERIAFEERGSV